MTIWDIDQQGITTQLVAHDKAVYDISFSLEQSVFATVGEDGSVRLFDTRELRNSNIVYESNPRVGLTHVKWNLKNPHMMAVVAQDDNKVMLFDKRKPYQIYETLYHGDNPDHHVSAIAWSPNDANMICSVGKAGNALIWDLSQEELPSNLANGGQIIREPKSEYTTE